MAITQNLASEFELTEDQIASLIHLANSFQDRVILCLLLHVSKHVTEQGDLKYGHHSGTRHTRLTRHSKAVEKLCF